MPSCEAPAACCELPVESRPTQCRICVRARWAGIGGRPKWMASLVDGAVGLHLTSGLPVALRGVYRRTAIFAALRDVYRRYGFGGGTECTDCTEEDRATRVSPATSPKKRQTLLLWGCYSASRGQPDTRVHLRARVSAPASSASAETLELTVTCDAAGCLTEGRTVQGIRALDSGMRGSDSDTRTRHPRPSSRSSALTPRSWRRSAAALGAACGLGA